MPAVVALPGAGELAEGTVIAVDGSTGEIFVDPSAEKKAQLEAAAAERKAALAASTGSGCHLRRSQGAAAGERRRPGGRTGGRRGGCRGRRSVPYRVPLPRRQQATRRPRRSRSRRTAQVLEAFPEGRVVVRVLDAGADKPLDFLTPADEPNPALGVRGLRTLLDHPDVLRTQLTALAKAAEGLPVYLEVMAPMVADRADAKAFADACREAGLRAKFGAMVEIPSAALRARSILQEVEFLSLGTNDLAQYTFAADRQVGAVSRLQDPWQPALLDLVALSAEAAKAEGKSCGVCGEAASDPLLACVLTGLGVTSPFHGCGVDSLCAGDAGQVHAGAVRARGRRGAGRGHAPRRRAAPRRRCCPASSRRPSARSAALAVRRGAPSAGGAPLFAFSACGPSGCPLVSEVGRHAVVDAGFRGDQVAGCRCRCSRRRRPPPAVRGSRPSPRRRQP